MGFRTACQLSAKNQAICQLTVKYFSECQFTTVADKGHSRTKSEITPQ